MTVGSLFSGIGGFDLGLERAGMEIRWQVEIDPFCQAVLAKHWPHVKRYDDVRIVGAHNLECVDLLCGGFPCQDLSSAGKRAGIDGERSGLYREFVRVIRELRPKGAIVENVHHAWRQWVPVLRRELWTIGYASLPIRVQASDFGAWHQRRRVFLMAHVDPSVVRLESWRAGWPFWTDPPLFADADPPRCSDREGRAEDARIGRDGSFAPDADALRELQPEGRITEQRGWASYGGGWAPEPDVVRVVHGVSSRLHGCRMAARIAALGNAVLPQIPEWIGRRLMELDASE